MQDLFVLAPRYISAADSLLHKYIICIFIRNYSGLGSSLVSDFDEKFEMGKTRIFSFNGHEEIS